MEHNIIAVIPARGGSKGIKGKNIVDFCGKPLIAWSIIEAVNSKMFDRVLVSTDSREIAKVARKYGAETPFLRPVSLSKGNVHSVHVVLHALTYLSETESYEPNAVAMLLPTSPLRSKINIIEAVKLYLTKNSNSVISITGTGKNLNNLRFIEKDSNYLSFVSGDIDPNEQRQGQKEIFTVNGAIFISNVRTLQEKKTFHSSNSLGYLMSKDSSIDINYPHDLQIAKQIFEKQNV